MSELRRTSVRMRVADALIHDLRFGLRSLGRSPAFVLTAILSLGLGIGASAAAFGVIDAVRLRALPFRDADRLVLLSEERIESTPSSTCAGGCQVSYETYDQVLRTHAFRTLDRVAAFTSGAKALNTGDQSLLVNGSIVSPNVFELLGHSALRGRVFTEEDNRLGVPLVTILSHDFWTSSFGADPSIPGRVIKLSDSQYTVIGVMPAGFDFEIGSDFWLPVVPTLDPSTRPSIRSVNVLARMAPGRSIEQLRAELNAVQPAPTPGVSGTIATRLDAVPLRARYVNSTRAHDYILAAVVACVLLIACFNLANLVLVRTLHQQRELATRAALGAGSAQLMRHVLLQNLILVAGAVVLGLLLAWQLLHVLESLTILNSLRPRGMEYRLDLRVFAFTNVLAVLAAVLLSFVPARVVGRTNAQQVLRETSSTTSTSRWSAGAQRVFVVVQIAVAVMLLAGAGLLVRTALRLAQVDPGFDAARLLQTTPSLPHPWRVEETYMPLFDRILAELGTVPGVSNVALRAPVPFAPRGSNVQVTLQDRNAPLPSSLVPGSAFAISRAYFATLDVSMARGRAFSDQDAAGAPAVAIISEWTARQWWPDQNAVGRTLRVTGGTTAPLTLTVIGVVRDNRGAQASLLFNADAPEIYRPFAQVTSPFPTFLVRAASPASVARDVRQIMLRRVPDRPLFTGLVQDGLNQQLRGVRTNAFQILGFAAVGLLLAVTGIYGVVSYAFGRRGREIAIRGALGATRAGIRGMVLRDAFQLTLIGLLAGVPAAMFASRLISDLLYGTSPNDPAVFVAVTIGITLVTLLASWIPAARAARVEPSSALR